MAVWEQALPLALQTGQVDRCPAVQVTMHECLKKTEVWRHKHLFFLSITSSQQVPSVAAARCSFQSLSSVTLMTASVSPSPSVNLKTVTVFTLGPGSGSSSSASSRALCFRIPTGWSSRRSWAAAHGSSTLRHLERRIYESGRLV